MSIFMQAYDYEIWDVVLDVLYVPMKTKTSSEALEPRQQRWMHKNRGEESVSKLQSHQYSSLHFKSDRVQSNFNMHDRKKNLG